MFNSTTLIMFKTTVGIPLRELHLLQLQRACVCVWAVLCGPFPHACSHDGTNSPSILFPTFQATKWPPYQPTLRAGSNKTTQAVWERPTGTFLLLVTKHREGKGSGLMTWLQKYEKCAAGTLWLKIDCKLFSHWLRGEVTICNRFCLIWWKVQKFLPFLGNTSCVHRCWWTCASNLIWKQKFSSLKWRGWGGLWEAYALKNISPVAHNTLNDCSLEKQEFHSDKQIR